MTDAAIDQLIGIFQDFQPNIVLTHNPVDPFNPDHPVASQMVQKAQLYRQVLVLPAHSAELHRLTFISLNPTSLNFATSNPMCSLTSPP